MLRRLSPALACLAVIAPHGARAGETVPPVSWGASYIADALTVADGGLDRGGAVVARADAWLDVDGTALNLRGVSFHIDAMVTHGPDFSGTKVGDFQTVSNVQAETLPHIYEAWAEASLTPSLAMKAGLVDLNSEFDVQETGALFLNSAHGIGPDFSQSGLNGPSIFPMAASAVVLRWARNRTILRIGLFDAVAGARHDSRVDAIRLPGASGALIVAEAEVPLGILQAQFGAWRYSQRFAAIDPAQPPAPSQGAYGLVEGKFTPHASAWVRAGVADARANPIASYIVSAVFSPRGRAAGARRSAMRGGHWRDW